MTARSMYKDFFIDSLRYLFDGALLTIIWVWQHITILNIDGLWTDNFGAYADVAKISVQVALTIIIAITAFYRMRREILKFRKEKKESKDKSQGDDITK